MRPWLSLLIVSLLGCGSHEPTRAPEPVGPGALPPPRTTPLPTDTRGATPSGLNAFAAGSNHFAFNLWSQRPAGNQVVAPGSITLALAMTWAGARGDTASQIGEVFHFGESTHPAAAGLLNAYNEATSPLAVANRLYGEQTYQLRSEYLELVRSRYAAPMELVDFKTGFNAARERINTWVEDRTHERIQDLLPDGAVDGTTRLVLVNAAYFLGKWAHPFEPNATYNANFSSGADANASVPTMHLRGSLRYASADGAKVLEMPYENGRFSMVFVLPEARFELPALEQTLNAERWASWMGQLRPGEVDVALPKFEVRLRPSLSLVESLKALGARDAFDPELANFEGMAEPRPDREGLYVTEVLHQAFLRVDEEGTEAAAATAVIMAEGAGMPAQPDFVFNADQPFLFALRDTQTGLVLFLGRVNDPR